MTFALPDSVVYSVPVELRNFIVNRSGVKEEMMELLSPAGGPAQLRAALRFGADAVYGGLKRFGLRAAADNFDWEELDEALRLVHASGKRFYLTMNILPYDEEMEALAADAGRAREPICPCISALRPM